jgi:hypothetical protein
VIVTVLHVLGTLDGAFAGFRAAQSRTGIVRRGRIDADALVWGAVCVQPLLVALELAGLAACMVGGITTWEKLTHMGTVMSAVYGAYAAAIGLGFALRLLPSIDARAASSIAVMGPGTLLRLPVVALGAFVAWYSQPTGMVAGFGVLVLGSAAAIGVILDRAGGRFHR